MMPELPEAFHPEGYAYHLARNELRGKPDAIKSDFVPFLEAIPHALCQRANLSICCDLS
jgi:hypothetical protein